MIEQVHRASKDDNRVAKDTDMRYADFQMAMAIHTRPSLADRLNIWDMDQPTRDKVMDWCDKSLARIDKLQRWAAIKPIYRDNEIYRMDLDLVPYKVQARFITKNYPWSDHLVPDWDRECIVFDGMDNEIGSFPNLEAAYRAMNKR